MLHQWRIKHHYYNLLLTELKTLEVRVGYNSTKKVVPNDIIIFPNYSKQEFRVKDVRVYSSFYEMSKHEDLRRIVPDVPIGQVLDILYNIYPPSNEALGVYIFELEINHPIIQLSQMIGHSSFQKLVDEAYQLTDWICKDYPQHFSHYYQKYVPGLQDGTREILLYKVAGVPLGVCILKNTPDEKKISTLFVCKESRGRGVSRKLLQQAFEILGTTTPVITIADYKYPEFRKIILDYGWKISEVLPKGYYNQEHEEYVFNSTKETL